MHCFNSLIHVERSIFNFYHYFVCSSLACLHIAPFTSAYTHHPNLHTIQKTKTCTIKQKQNKYNIPVCDNNLPQMITIINLFVNTNICRPICHVEKQKKICTRTQHTHTLTPCRPTSPTTTTSTPVASATATTLITTTTPSRIPIRAAVSPVISSIEANSNKTPATGAANNRKLLSPSELQELK